MNEEEIKKKELLRRQRMLEQQMIQQSSAQQQEALKKVVMLKILDKAARERLTNLKLIKPELANNLELYLVQLYQTGQLKTRITEKELVQILSMMQKKKDFKIIRK
ncbi:MAG: hypothetical protein B6U68_04160 [Candidatus Aenigmarchaeota archaeon ex4484_14]|nr:MAG: hypothetical protein B6U68_04160 [Candidatus Aenigmarchaeota archaeon ex4484_14]